MNFAGAYFAETSCLADKYSPAGEDGLHVPWIFETEGGFRAIIWQPDWEAMQLAGVAISLGSTNYEHNNTVDGRNPAPC